MKLKSKGEKIPKRTVDFSLTDLDRPDFVENMIEKTRSSLCKSVAAVLGALLFLEKILQTSHQQAAKNMVYEGLNLAQYGPQKALLNYFMFRNSNFENPLENPLAHLRLKYLNR